jgi:hypothetical protein
MRFFLSISVLVVLVGVAHAKPRPMKPAAKKHYELGIKHYAEKHFEEANLELAEAYEIDRHPNIVYTWAQSERLAGNCERAIELYLEYMEFDLSAAQESAARVNVDRCRRLLPDEGEEGDDGASNSEDVGSGDEDDEGDDDRGEDDEGQVVADSGKSNRGSGGPDMGVGKEGRTGSSPWYTDTLGLGLVTVGVAGLGVAGWSYQSAREAEKQAPMAGPDEYERLRKKSSDRRTLAAISAAAGGVAIAAAIVKFSLRSGGDEDEGDSKLGVLTGDGSVGLTFSGFF